MSKTRLIAVISAVLFLRWLAVGHVALTVAGATVSVPALAAGFLAPVIGLTRTADFYGAGVVLLALSTLIVNHVRQRPM